MAACATCNTTILFGGKTEGELRFCNERCQADGQVLLVADRIPEDLVKEQAAALHGAPCPKCSGPGPVDVHVSHFVWSALLLTSHTSTPSLCCRSCGKKSQLLSLFGSLLLGWWGIPWGFIMTPIQISRNIGGLLSPPDPSRPSERLHGAARMMLASQALASRGV